jgi:transcriptional regulator with XRE-family HTH domain
MPKEVKIKIGENVRKYRNRVGISQDVLSKKANLSFYTITKIEAGGIPNPTIKTAKKIADALEVSIDDLVK